MGLDLITPYACSTLPCGDHRSGLRWLPFRDPTTSPTDGLLGAYQARFAPIALSR